MSRDLSALHPLVTTKARKFLMELERQGITVLVTCTLRTMAEQAEVYAQGRTKPGRIVTYAGPGDSWHNWGRAIDVVPIRAGKPVWGTTGEDLVLWKRIGAIGESVGFEWAGRWAKFREFPHFQDTLGASLAALKAGQHLA